MDEAQQGAVTGMSAQQDEDRRAEAHDALPVIGIGASAGGLEALRDMLAPARLPTGMAYVVVQHLDPNHESLLAELLGRQTALSVRQAVHDEQVAADHVYIIPPGHGLEIERGVLKLIPFEQPRGLRRPIDDFFVSLAEDARTLSACVILSGTGADGTLGLRAIKEGGGLAIVQDPATARYDGMPLSAQGTGMVDFVLAPDEMLAQLKDYFSRATGGAAAPVSDEQEIGEICRVLRDRTGHDFTGYKPTTLARRIQRRMQVLQIEVPAEYRLRVRDDGDEAAALLRDLLINVTRFFRDPEHFHSLRDKVIAPLVAAHGLDDEIRIWVPGCSSGEEAYSVAMLFSDEMSRQKRHALVQIFATDIDDQMLEQAREGRYLSSSLTDIPPDFRDRFTIQHGDHFRIAPHLRDMIRFSPHSVIKDPPFSRLNLICCRNLFIYFGDRLQAAVLPIFHYALVAEGTLFLGPSETVGRAEDLFAPLDQKARIFTRQQGRTRYPIELPAGRNLPRRGTGHGPRDDDRRRERPGAQALERIADRYARPAVVLDEEGRMVASYGRLGRYFEFSASSGLAADHARPGLREILMPLMREALDTQRRTVSRGLTVRAEFGRQELDVIADPLADGTVLVVFLDTGAFVAEADDDLLEMGPTDGQVEMLERELQLTRQRLRDKTEELETANEELKSSNEEMMSMNEELQSTNEELSTVNDELKDKVDQLSIANDDLQNFFDSTQLPVVVVDSEMRLRSFTEAALGIFPFQKTDRGRPLTQVTSLLATDAHLDAARAVIGGEEDRRLRTTHADGSRHWMLNIRPYRMRDGRQDGATLVFTDITEILALQDELSRERERLQLAVRLARIGIWEYLPDSERIVIDQTQAMLLGIDDPGGHPVESVLELIAEPDRDMLRERLSHGIAGIGDFEAEVRLDAAEGDRARRLRSLGRPVTDSDPVRMVGVTFDVTADREAAETRELMIREMNHRVKNLFAVISALVSTTARGAADKAELETGLRDRIAALGRAHSLTNERDGGRGVEFDGLVRAVLAPYFDQLPISVEGPPLEAAPGEMTPLALILHEWATNGVKYGALRDGGGSLEVTWTAPEDGGWELIWREYQADDGPAGGADSGFGSRLVQITAQQLGARLDKLAEGNIFQWKLTKPR